MTKTTEWLLRAALLLVIVYVGWQLALQTVAWNIQLANRLAACEQGKKASSSPAPPPGASAR